MSGEVKSGLVIVAGAGPGLGTALMSRFSRSGYNVVGLTRTGGSTSDNHSKLVALDLTDQTSVKDRITELVEQFGPPRIVVHNTAHLNISPFLDITSEDFQSVWQNSVLGAVHLAQSTLPPMVAAGDGAFLVSGATASLRGGARFAAFASAKFALRGLTQSLAREFQPQGIHVAHIILDGIIDTPNSRKRHGMPAERMMATMDSANQYFQLAHQPASTWTQELDLRPSSESF